jgi:ribose transport system ATP-binding protein
VPKASVPAASAPVLQLDGAASGNAGPLSLSVRRGEVLGLVGLRGAGHEAISRAIFGREPLSAGRMRLLGANAVHLPRRCDSRGRGVCRRRAA